MAYIETLGGLEIVPAHGSGKFTIATNVDAARNELGNFIGQVVGDDKLKIEVSFKYMTPEQLQELLRIWDRSQGGAFVNKFRVYDPRVNDFVVKTMYVGDRSGRPYHLNPRTGKPNFFVDIQANLIEV